MKVFIDFDRTLFDSTRLRLDICRRFTDVPQDVLDAHHTAYRQQEPFTVVGFSNYLTKQGINGAIICKMFYEHASRGEQYLFQDASYLLQSLRDRGHQTILITKTAESDVELWQKPKINSSGLLPLLDGVHITTTTKPEVIQALGVNEPFIFIDDKQSEIDAMRTAFPDALCLKHEVGAPLLDHLDQIEAFVNKK